MSAIQAERLEVMDGAAMTSRLSELGLAEAFALIEGPEFSGFTVVTRDALCLPPMSRSPSAPAREFVSEAMVMTAFEVRIFSEEVEWHAWRAGAGGWESRIVRAAEWKEDTVLEERQVLWGTKADAPATCDRDGLIWRRYHEDRGAAIWLPVALEEAALPLELVIANRVAPATQSGLAECADARLVGLIDREGRPLRPPAPRVEDQRS